MELRRFSEIEEKVRDPEDFVQHGTISILLRTLLADRNFPDVYHMMELKSNYFKLEPQRRK
jgi:hypothetical protein